MTIERATEIARANQPDAEIAAKALDDAGCRFAVARRALRAVFRYDVLGCEYWVIHRREART